MRKPYRFRFMIETLISKVEDIEEKRVFIEMYNDKLKRLGLDERYEKIPFEKI